MTKNQQTCARKKCRTGLKAAGKTCVDRKVLVTIELDPYVCEGLNQLQERMAQRAQAIREAVAAGKAITGG